MKTKFIYAAQKNHQILFDLIFIITHYLSAIMIMLTKDEETKFIYATQKIIKYYLILKIFIITHYLSAIMIMFTKDEDQRCSFT